MANNRKQDVLYIKPGSLQAWLCHRKKLLNDRGILSLPSNYRIRYGITAGIAILCGCFFLLAGLGFILRGFLYYYSINFICGPIILLEGLILLSMGIRAVRIRHRIGSLSRESEVGWRFGVDTSTLQQVVKEHDIPPRCVVNGENLYDIADFGDVATLLRASSLPLSSLTLLRSVASAESLPDHLLRASESISAGAEPLEAEKPTPD